MAGNLAVIEHSNKNSARLREQWEICFARFIPYPTLPPSSDLLPLPPRLRNLSPRGNWISSSSVAFLRLSLSHLLLTVSFNAALLEEHYVTKLHFTWPQVSCVSGYPARGIRTVIVSYRDSLGEIQKFAMRFPTIYEAESFINVLKEILKGDKDPEPLNTDFGSEISSQSEFMSTNKLSHSRACEDLSFMTPVDNYIPQLPLYANNEVGRPLGSQEKGTTSGHNFEGMLPALPPSFSTLLMDCSQNNHAQPTFSDKIELKSFVAAQSIVSEEIELKSQIVRYMEDSSFQDMLVKVEKVISELGGDMSL
ncbi:hypothetical protein GLYMA_18G143200v4 [Glycine max]|uniref:Poor homologous synapsis 1 PH domain-containing protein n=2 Tax=Glycine subgen. Soja TaxID=1462606 RepID=K7MS34_SOYBN|nr:protein POOR HOMOLOGOUS SYNAPSIS 1 isoform X1 [Glycine max]XP_028213717.1 protein POOR HOMOLOGOUS SYNAPSIS 1 isoform X1 [Glycine soja]KAH1154518.1 hypothetical protein GYH30_049981 [Glycine max]KRG99416.1 hypothetical protein GLYMA_18G143200v4 [Glycine max]RZB52035.1 Protein POOR HOMOLOGOUS SYNAPSIS 1 isoform A [Glycine soja]|eukprot:XP_006602399.1 protein POOR HOMOLOGOUS SYNAPSIS 1 isoform X1 [Glycine max]